MEQSPKREVKSVLPGGVPKRIVMTFLVL